MKKIIAVAIIVLVAGQLFAQKTIRISELNNQEVKTVFKKNKRDGFYGALSSGYSPINNSNGAVFSARACWIMDHWFAVGVGGTGFASNVDKFDYINFSSSSENFLGGAYGGLVFEPILMPLKPIHVSFPILVGGGAVASLTDEYYYDYYPLDDYFFVVEPGIEIELNLTKWLRASIFATYRYTSDVEIDQIASDALRTYSTGLALKVGLF